MAKQNTAASWVSRVINPGISHVEANVYLVAFSLAFCSLSTCNTKAKPLKRVLKCPKPMSATSPSPCEIPISSSKVLVHLNPPSSRSSAPRSGRPSRSCKIWTHACSSQKATIATWERFLAPCVTQTQTARPIPDQPMRHGSDGTVWRHPPSDPPCSPLANDGMGEVASICTVHSLVLLGQALVAQVRGPPQGQLRTK